MKPAAVLVPLGLLLDWVKDDDFVQLALDAFDCFRDDDVELFLRRYAVVNERNGASRSYMAIDELAFADGRIRVVAFFTIAVTVADYSSVSNRRRRKIMGNVPYVGSKNHFPGYLLAQLARSDEYSHQDFDCSSLIVQAERLVKKAVETVGGQIIYLDCKRSLVLYYERQGYSVLHDSENESGLLKMFKYLN